jgi:hypothetical protein
MGGVSRILFFVRFDTFSARSHNGFSFFSAFENTVGVRETWRQNGWASAAVAVGLW